MTTSGDDDTDPVEHGASGEPGGALDDLVVADLSDRVAGQYTGRMFAAFGASVTLVERPGGSTTRSLAPLRTTAGRSWSLLFEHLDGAKGSMERTASGEPPDPEIAALVARADVVIRDAGDDALAAIGTPVGPRTVQCVIGDFPADGPYSDWRGDEMIHTALCGTMYQTGAHDSFPLYGVGHRAEYAAGTTAFVSALVALYERDTSGLGQTTTTTLFESLAAMAENTVTLYGYSHTQPPRRPSDLLGTIRCADGWVVIFALTGWEELCEIFGAPGLVHDPRFERSRDRVGNWAAAVDALNEAAATRPAAELVRRCQERKIICEQIVSPAELVAGDQWRDRHMVVTHPPAEGSQRDGRSSPVEHALGPTFRIDGGGFTAGRAPALGAHDPIPARPRRAASDPAAMNDPTVTAAHTTPVGGNSTLPLSGLRVVDLTTAWSGPMATRGLAYFGAEVIKVEPPTRLDAWRGMYLGRTSPFFPDSDGGERRFNRCCSFNTQGHDKASFGLDITAPGGREVMADLLACSDVLIANYSSGVLDRLGFGHAATRAINPRLIVVEMPAFGAGGPLSGHVAMGSTMEAACSMASLIGYGDGRPTLTGSTILDPIGGLNGTAAVLVALRNRQRTGVGCHVEVAQTEVAAHWIGEYLLAALEGVDVPPPEGNTVAEAEPHDAYPCSGRDQWVAISVPDDTAWRGLCTTIGEPGLADDERFSTPSARAANRAELAACIGAWTARHTKLDAAAKLQTKGCPAAPVNRGADVFFDPALRASGFIVSEDHPEAGRSDYPGLAYRLDRTGGSIRTPAPLFGADNRRILESILGYGATRIDELYANSAVCDAPYNPRKQRPGTERAVEGAT